MDYIRFTIESNEEILKFIDKSLDFILVHSFQPQNTSGWWTTTIKINPITVLENIKVRNMQFDIETNLNGLKEILELKSDFLEIYQFAKPISGGLIIENLPENNLETILLQNGLQHKISVRFEVVEVESVQSDFIKSIFENPLFSSRIQSRIQ